MFADIGGYLGMFLGWSCISVILRFYQKFKTFKCVVKYLWCNDCKRRRNKILELYVLFYHASPIAS